MGSVLLLVLTALAFLSDEVGKDCDLRRFDDGNRRYFWRAFTARQAAYFLDWFIFGGSQARTVAAIVATMDWSRFVAPLLAGGSLIVVRSRVLDDLVPLAAIGFYVWLYWPQTLTTRGRSALPPGWRTSPSPCAARRRFSAGRRAALVGLSRHVVSGDHQPLAAVIEMVGATGFEPATPTPPV